ncbi:serine/threonine-protein phosphatase 6 regulatory subunit 3-like isoform X2 [Ananas comosus]|uniref:Serine/threonine-protein phosphatase 6 regulatory subunit 3-like isoform X2 n=1 Tax=Ananas comosus TaxID=4615 RepID=A0A6P5H7G9_ANACO|nr:serine/threonine-protein phosphatase 6 regulatory subunit 3-like isoform X2 [Ananas comosus]
MFWQIPSLSAPSPVELILDKENFTLEELLDEEEIIQECKALNTRLISFLGERAQVEQLLQFIIEDAPEDADNKRAFKFPFIACEIFTCEIDVILKTLVEDEELMNMLFSFLELNHTHNSILAGYFSKVVICLMSRKMTSLMKYVKTHEAIFRKLVDLIGITSIMEILVRLVGGEDHMYPNSVDVMQWLADTNLLDMIVDKLCPSSTPEEHANAAEVLCIIIQNAPSALAAKLSSQNFIHRIFGHALEHSPSKSALIHSLSVCIALLDPKKPSSSGFFHSLRSQHLYESSVHINFETICAMLSKLGDLLELLNVSSDGNTLCTSYGELHPPLGKHRLIIVEFVTVLLETGYEASDLQIIKSGVIQKILDLFFKYPFNNFLHHHVEKLIMACLESNRSAIIDHLFAECNIIRKFLNADKTPLLSDSNPVTIPAAGRKPPRAGHIGHISRICNKLTQLGISNDHVQAYLQESGEWLDWLSYVLHERNTVENINHWTCGRPTMLQERTRDSDDDELHDSDYDITALANNLSEAFRNNVYESDNRKEANGSLDQDDEDVYHEDTTKVIISSLRLGGDHQSCIFTNSNWFAFQEDSLAETMSTSVLGKMNDINLSGATSVVAVRSEQQVKNAVSPSGCSLSCSCPKIDTANGLSGPTDARKPHFEDDDIGLFQFDTTENEDLFSDQPLPEWVGWHQPSDIQVLEDGSSDLPSRESAQIEESKLPCLFEADAEFVGVDMEGVGRAVEQALEEGMDIGGISSALKRKIVLTMPQIGAPVDEIVDFNQAHWCVEPEMGIVQE